MQRRSSSVSRPPSLAGERLDLAVVVAEGELVVRVPDQAVGRLEGGQVDARGRDREEVLPEGVAGAAVDEREVALDARLRQLAPASPGSRRFIVSAVHSTAARARSLKVPVGMRPSAAASWLPCTATASVVAQPLDDRVGMRAVADDVAQDPELVEGADGFERRFEGRRLEWMSERTATRIGARVAGRSGATRPMRWHEPHGAATQRLRLPAHGAGRGIADGGGPLLGHDDQAMVLPGRSRSTVTTSGSPAAGGADDGAGALQLRAQAATLFLALPGHRPCRPRASAAGSARGPPRATRRRGR